jgi:hypothetical protein
MTNLPEFEDVPWIEKPERLERIGKVLKDAVAGEHRRNRGSDCGMHQWVPQRTLSQARS